MIDYFIFAYVKLTHGFIYLTGNYFVAAGIPLLLGDGFERFSVKKAFKLLLEILGCILVMELFASIYFALLHRDDYVPFAGGVLTLVLYSTFVSKRKLPVKIMWGSAYIALCSLGLSVTMSMGALLGKPYYYLQWVLILTNAMLIFSSAFFIRNFSVGEEIVPSTACVAIICAGSALGFLFAILRLRYNVDPAASIAFCLILIFMSLLLYFMVNYLLKKSHDNAHAQASELIQSFDRDVMRMSKENLESLRSLKHEMKTNTPS